MAGWPAGGSASSFVIVAAGAGKSAPADYERPRHVDAAVIGDIAEWLVPGRGKGPITRVISGMRRQAPVSYGLFRLSKF